jgi:hypothetical protein
MLVRVYAELNYLILGCEHQRSRQIRDGDCAFPTVGLMLRADPELERLQVKLYQSPFVPTHKQPMEGPALMVVLVISFSLASDVIERHLGIPARADAVCGGSFVFSAHDQVQVSERPQGRPRIQRSRKHGSLQHDHPDAVARELPQDSNEVCFEKHSSRLCLDNACLKPSQHRLWHSHGAIFCRINQPT